MTDHLDQSPDDFDELDNLLAGAVKLAEARKAQKLAAKNKKSLDPALQQLAEAAEQAMTWEPQCAVARFVEEHCACGASHRRFDGWFILSHHRRDPNAKKFSRNGGHEGLPSWQYTALSEVDYCIECLSEEALPLATIDTLIGIDALGQPCDCDCGQLTLNLPDETISPEEEDALALELDAALGLGVED